MRILALRHDIEVRFDHFVCACMLCSSTLTRRLDEFGHRLESMERQVAEKHGAHAVASTDLTLAEQQGLSEMSIRYPNKPGDQQATGSSSDAPAKARVGDDSFTASPSHAQKSASGVTSAPRHLQRENTQGVAKMGQAQRERYMQKFEKDEIFGKSVETLEMEKTRKLDNALAHHGHLLANWMLMPGSRFRLMWDSMTCLLVLFVAISLPYRVAFLMDYIDAGLNVRGGARLRASTACDDANDPGAELCDAMSCTDSSAVGARGAIAAATRH